MGYGPLRRLVTVELPLATPVIIAGLRVGVVSGISLASVGQLIGVSSLGYLFIDGLQRSFPTEIYVGLVLVIVLALVCDLILVGVGRALTPWAVARMSFFSYAWDWITSVGQLARQRQHPAAAARAPRLQRCCRCSSPR